MPISSRRAGVTALAATLSLGLAACSNDTSTPSAAPTSSTANASTTGSPSASSSPSTSSTDSMGMLMPVSTGNPFVDARTAASHMPMTATALSDGFVAALGIKGDSKSPATELTVGLTSLLQEHVYLAGIAVDTAYVAGADSAEFKAAADVLDANSQDLAKAVTAVGGKENGDAFLKLWRAHIGFFVDYAVAKKTGDDAGAKKAQTSLDGYTSDAGAFFESVTKGALPKAAVAKELKGHVKTLSAAIDAFAAGSPKGFDLLKAAADHVVMSAPTLAGGFVTAAKVEGNPKDAASGLRLAVTSNLQEHVYLAGIAVFTAYTAEGGPKGKAFEAAAATLDKNTQELGAAITSLTDKDQGDAFLKLWRAHIGMFVDYALAAAGNDEAGKAKALKDLDGYRTDFGAFAESLTGGKLPADAVASELKTHVETLSGAIDSLKAALVK